MKMNKGKKGGINMDTGKTDPIKSSLGKPSMNAKPSGLKSSQPKGKNFHPKGMKK